MESDRPSPRHGVGRWIAAGVLTCSISMGCGGGASPAGDPSARLEPWAGPLRGLFDDSIHPAAVGLSLDGEAAHDDPLLLSRARAADVVARMRVTTVTADTVGAKQTYYLTVQVGDPPLMPAKLPNRTFELVVRPGRPSFGIVSSIDTGLRGRTFIGFVRRFAGEAEPEIHWHLTADTPQVALAISETTLREDVEEP